MNPKSILKAVLHLTDRRGGYTDCYIVSDKNGCVGMNHPANAIHVRGQLPPGFFSDGHWQVNGCALKRILPYLEDKPTFAESLGDYKLKVSKADPFEDLKPAERSMPLSAEALKLIATRVAPFCSTNEFRVAMMSVNFHNDGGSMFAVATDGHRLARYHLGVTEHQGGLMPRDLIGIAHEYLDGNVEIGWTDEMALIKNDTLELRMRGCDEQYPDYEKVMPGEEPCTLEVDTEHLLNKIRRAVAAADADTKQIRLHLGRECRIISDDPDTGISYNSPLLCNYTGGTDMTIGFNGDFLASGVAACNMKRTIVRLSTPQRVVRLGNDDFLFLCMPVRLSI